MSNKRDAEAAFNEQEHEAPSKTKKRPRHRSKKRKGDGLLQLDRQNNHGQESNTTEAPTPTTYVSQAVTSTEEFSKKRKDRKQKKERDGSTQVSKVSSRSDGKKKHHHIEQKSKKKQRRKTRGQIFKIKGRGQHEDAEEDGWRLSTGNGGLFLDQDPILTADGKHLILPTKSSVHVYSASSSLLVRQLRVQDRESVTSCVVSSTNPGHILISTFGGTISKWDWSTGKKVHQWNFDGGLLRLMDTIQTSADAVETLLVLRRNKEGQQHVILLNLNTASSDTGEKTIMSRARLLPVVRATDDGSILILCAEDRLLVGKTDSAVANETPRGYTWRELTVPENIVSMDVRFRQVSSKPGRERIAVDCVLGFKSGVIQIYEDILRRIVEKEKKSLDDEISSRRLHWHRGAVNTVKWSRDGNYLISGGDETVLVIWQLDTNQQQFLPHLSTSILNLSVSAAGSSYSLRLADNSVMVLSTADLLPSTNISGPAVAVHGAVTAAMHPTNANQLLLAASSNVSPRQQQRQSSSTLLQTYDIASSLQTGRQALTRNMTTAINVGPSGQTIAEPNVTFMQLSHDGQWLITTDEWTPPKSDLEHFGPASDPKSETCLRFWLWNRAAQIWELVTRIDDPHTGANLLGLVVSPVSLQATTIGADGSLRIWSPKSRVRSGVPVKDQAGTQLYTWTSSKVLQIESQVAPEEPTANPQAAIAYSGDGSVIAASWSIGQNSLRFTYLIDVKSGSVSLSQPNLLTKGKARISFLGRQLLCLSQKFCVWDTVSMKTTFAIALKDEYLSKTEVGLLAANAIDGNFALAFNPSEKSGFAQVAVFNVNNVTAGPAYQGSVRGRVNILLPLPQSSGFVVVDKEARIKTLTAPSRLPASSMALKRPESEDVKRGLDSIFGSRAAKAENEEQIEDNAVKALPAAVLERNAGTRSIENLFASQTGSRPLSVKDMFDKVAGLFVRVPAAAD